MGRFANYVSRLNPLRGFQRARTTPYRITLTEKRPFITVPHEVLKDKSPIVLKVKQSGKLIGEYRLLRDGERFCLQDLSVSDPKKASFVLPRYDGNLLKPEIFNHLGVVSRFKRIYLGYVVNLNKEIPSKGIAFSQKHNPQFITVKAGENIYTLVHQKGKYYAVQFFNGVNKVSSLGNNKAIDLQGLAIKREGNAVNLRFTEKPVEEKVIVEKEKEKAQKPDKANQRTEKKSTGSLEEAIKHLKMPDSEFLVGSYARQKAEERKRVDQLLDKILSRVKPAEIKPEQKYPHVEKLLDRIVQDIEARNRQIPPEVTVRAEAAVQCSFFSQFSQETVKIPHAKQTGGKAIAEERITTGQETRMLRAKARDFSEIKNPREEQTASVQVPNPIASEEGKEKPIQDTTSRKLNQSRQDETVRGLRGVLWDSLGNRNSSGGNGEGKKRQRDLFANLYQEANAELKRPELLKLQETLSVSRFTSEIEFKNYVTLALRVFSCKNPSKPTPIEEMNLLSGRLMKARLQRDYPDEAVYYAEAISNIRRAWKKFQEEYEEQSIMAVDQILKKNDYEVSKLEPQILFTLTNRILRMNGYNPERLDPKILLQSEAELSRMTIDYCLPGKEKKLEQVSLSDVLAALGITSFVKTWRINRGEAKQLSRLQKTMPLYARPWLRDLTLSEGEAIYEDLFGVQIYQLDIYSQAYKFYEKANTDFKLQVKDSLYKFFSIHPSDKFLQRGKNLFDLILAKEKLTLEQQLKLGKFLLEIAPQLKLDWQAQNSLIDKLIQMKIEKERADGVVSLLTEEEFARMPEDLLANEIVEWFRQNHKYTYRRKSQVSTRREQPLPSPFEEAEMRRKETQ